MELILIFFDWVLIGCKSQRFNVYLIMILLVTFLLRSFNIDF